MIALYFLGITEFQDMLTPMLELQKSGYKCWVCIFDCVTKKRQFYYYTEKELKDYIKEICEKNSVKIPKISFFGLDDQSKFEKEYRENNPKTVFLQSSYQKYPRWMPTAENSNVVHFSWGKDSIQNLSKSSYKNIVLSILRYKKDSSYFPEGSKYFGNFKLEQLLYEPIEKNLDFLKQIKKEQLVCYIPESWIYYNKDPKGALEFTNAAVKEIQDHGYKIVWKKREKGYPTDESSSILRSLTKQPDFTIQKDIYFPTSLVYFSTISTVNITFGITNSLEDVKEVRNKDSILHYDYGNQDRSELTRFIVENTKTIKPEIDLSSIGRPSLMLINYLKENNWI